MKQSIIIGFCVGILMGFTAIHFLKKETEKIVKEMAKENVHSATSGSPTMYVFSDQYPGGRPQYRPPYPGSRPQYRPPYPVGAPVR